jgi:hypothetical protein
MQFLAGTLHSLPVLRDRTRSRQCVDLDAAISVIWRRFADGEISEDIAQRADTLLRAERDKIVVPLQRRPGGIGFQIPVWL